MLLALRSLVEAASGSADFSAAITDGADALAASVSPVVAASSATTDGADVLAAAVTVVSASANFSSATTDGADVAAAVVSPIVGATSATTDGADVAAAAVSPVVGVTSATTDGADAAAAVVSPIISVSSAKTDGADVAAAIVSPIVGATSATTDGADVLASAVAPVISVTSATTDGADVLAASVSIGSVAANFSSATTDGADTAAAVVSPIVAATSATTDGADVLAASVSTGSAAANFSSATTDGADTAAAVVSPVVAFSSAKTDGADILAALVAPVGASVSFSSATTDGADVLAAAVSPFVAGVTTTGFVKPASWQTDLTAQIAQGKVDFNRPTTVPSIPKPIANVDSLARAVEAIKAYIDTREGTAGSVLDSNVTVRDLLDGGVVNIKIGNTTYGNAISTVTSPYSTTAATSISGGTGSVGYVDPRPYFDTPPAPTNLQVNGAFKNVILSWDLIDFKNFSYVEIYRASSSSGDPGVGAAARVGTANANQYVDPSAVQGVTYYYWIRAVSINTSGISVTGPYNGVPGTAGGLLYVNGVDLSPLTIQAGQMADGTITAAKIGDYQISATKFASSIAPIGLYSTTPTSNVGPVIFNTTDFKLYRWDTTAGLYTAAIAGADVVGSVSTADIADGSIAATKFASSIQPITLVTGALPTTYATKMIFRTDDGKLYKWNGTAYTAAITGFSDLTGTISGSQVTANSISGNVITANSLAAGSIVSASITATQIAAAGITGDRIAGTTITAGNLAANTITSGQIAANTITGDRIAGTTITAANIAGNTITAGQIQAGAIGTNQLAAQAVTAGKMLITGNGQALNLDPAFQDGSLDVWTSSFGVSGTATRTLVTDGVSGQYALRFTVPNSSSYVRVRSETFPTTAGKQYRVSGRIKCRSGTANIYMRLWYLDYSLTTVAAYALAQTSPAQTGNLESVSVPTSSTWVRYAGVSAAPATAAFAYIEFYGSYLATATLDVQDLRCDECTDYDLVVDGAIIAGKLAASSVVAGTVAANAIVASNIVGGTITGDKLFAATITGDKIAGTTITAANIAGTTITAAQIQSGTITATQIAAGSITADRINSNGLIIRDGAGNIILGAGNALSAGYAASGTLNSGISINADGTLTGAGAGAVTVAGLDPSVVRSANPITSGNISTYIASAAISSAQIGDLRTSNYAEDGSGNPTAGVKLQSAGSAIKVASGSLQLGSVFFTDYWYRLVNAIDGSLSAGTVIWRGNNDSSTRGGAPNIDCLSIYTQGTADLGTNFMLMMFNYVIQPTALTDNLDSMRYMNLDVYVNAGGASAGWTEQVQLSDRIYANATHSNTANATKGSFKMIFRAASNPANTLYTTAGSPYVFNGHLLVTMFNAYGGSSQRWFHGYPSISNTTGTALVRDSTSPTGSPTAGSPTGSGPVGGFCPAPWVKITLLGGMQVNASDLSAGMRVLAVNDDSLQEIPSGGVVRDVAVRWEQRVRLTLADGRATEWSRNHRLFVVNKGWTMIQNLCPGDLIAGPTAAVVASVLATGEGQVVSFRVEGAGTYFGGDMLCHNMKSLLP